MGKSKKAKKTRGDDLSDDEAIESLESSSIQTNEEHDQISNKKNKKGRKKKDDDWEDEVSKELQELSKQDSKQQSGDEENIVETQKKQKKKTKGGKKAQQDSDDNDDIKVASSAFSMLSVEDSDNDLSENEIQPVQNKKKTKKEKTSKNAFNAFAQLSDEEDNDANLSENEIQPIQNKKKKSKKEKSSNNAFDAFGQLSDEEDNDANLSENEIEPMQNKMKKSKNKNAFDAFSQLSDEEDNDAKKTEAKSNKFVSFEDDGNESEERRSETPEIQPDQKAPKTKKEKKKKGKDKREDEDIDALLADIETKEKESKKKKKKMGEIGETKSDSLTEADDKKIVDESTAEPKQQMLSSNIEADEDEDGLITNMTQDQIAEMMEKDFGDGFEDDKKKKKKKKKGKDSTANDANAEDEDIDDEEETEGSTVKTAAQKKKEKRERQKLQKFQDNQKSKKPEGNKDIVAEYPKESEVKQSDAAIKAPSEEKDEVVELDDEDDKKKKKKKKKKGEEEEEKEIEKPKKKPSKMVLAMQEALAKQTEDIERQKREFEEKERLIEETRLAKIEKERLEKEKKEKEKVKRKERMDRLKAEGKYLTAKQKEEKARAMQMLESLKQQGVIVPEKTDDKPKKRIVYTNKKKKFTPKTEERSNISEEKEIVNHEPVNIIEKQDSIVIDTKVTEEPEEVKDAWDAESGEEEEKDVNQIETKTVDMEVELQDSKQETVELPKKIEVSTIQKEPTPEEESDESEEESDDESEEESESESESESEDEKLTPAERFERAKEKARENIKKRKDDSDAKKSADHLRAPIVCVLGHVDTGKTKILDKLRRSNVQDGEAGGITQQIGATNVPQHTIKEQTKMCKDFQKKELKIPGLLIIDTPGHESFANLRTRGSSLCDIAILVVDIMHGLEPQTIESINLLKSRKTPFVVALNKVDRLFQWQPNPHSDVHNTIKKQKPNTKIEFDERAQQVILEFSEQGLNTCLYYDNKNPREYISLVPTSAHSGDGMGSLIALLCELSQTLLVKRIMWGPELEAITMEVKALPGLGTTIDVILVNGKMKEGETLIIAGQEGPIVTQIRGLLMPQPLKELRVKNNYEKHKEIVAAQGVKIIAKDLDKAMAGLPAYVARSKDEVEVYKEEIEDAIGDILKSIKVSDLGVFVHASTIGSLEALLEFLRSSKIPFAGIGIGPIHKKDVLKASVMLEKDIQYAVILGFDIKVDRDAQEYADKEGVRIFTAEIIYHLFDSFMSYRDQLKKKKQEEFKDIAVFPCKLRILPQYIFNSRDPIVMGVIIEGGFVKIGTPICVPTKEFVELGRVGSIEFNHKVIDKATKGQEVCIKIEHLGGDAPKLYGRHFDENDLLMSKISRESIDAVKDWFRDDMTKGDWQLLVELKKIFQIL